MRPFVYVHGLPGSAAELDLGWPAGRTPPIVIAPSDVNAFASRAPSGPVRLIGFSLGAPAALRIAARWPERIARLILVSPAAPPAPGELRRMAGAPVFLAARRGPRTLAAVLGSQAVLARAAPSALLRLMFTGQAPAERRLLREEPVRAALVSGLRETLGPGRAGHAAALSAYAASSADDPVSIQAPVEIVHGAEDGWVPLRMAERLAAALGPGCTLTVLPGLGHYGALRAALAREAATD